VVIWEGGSAEHELPRKDRIVLGRAEECDVRIDHPSVSRKHAALLTRGALRIEDCGSSNGTRVGGRPIEAGKAVPIEAGTLVELGDVIVVVRRDEQESRHEAAPPAVPARAPNVVEDDAMTGIYQLVDALAASSISIVLLGETGVGKGLVAETIHARSPRAGKPFVRVNCAALPEALLESELFGHERGAFTGAVQAKPGLLESADGGTVFLDEVGEVPLATQAKLLHVLEHGEVQRIGSVRPRPIDVRFVSATNRELDRLVEEGRFRRDLFYRLSGEVVVIPPLRERPSEIAPMARGFVRETSASIGKSPPAISAEAIARLQMHSWPGNVRELKNVMARAALLCRGPEIGPEHLPLDRLARSASLRAQQPLPGAPDEEQTQQHPAATMPPPAAATGPRLRSAVRELEKQRIADALARSGGNQAEAAKYLGISRRTLMRRMTDFGLPRPRKGR